MAEMTATFENRQQITFSTRGRTSVNVRTEAEDGDGPIGFTSMELLLVALGNCSLGWLTSRELLADEPLDRVVSTITAEVQEEPPMLISVHSVIELEVQDASLLERQAELEAIACTCPVCNSLVAEKTVELKMRVAPGA